MTEAQTRADAIAAACLTVPSFTPTILDLLQNEVPLVPTQFKSVDVFETGPLNDVQLLADLTQNARAANFHKCVLLAMYKNHKGADSTKKETRRKAVDKLSPNTSLSTAALTKDNGPPYPLLPTSSIMPWAEEIEQMKSTNDGWILGWRYCTLICACVNKEYCVSCRPTYCIAIP